MPTRSPTLGLILGSLTSLTSPAPAQPPRPAQTAPKSISRPTDAAGAKNQSQALLLRDLPTLRAALRSATKLRLIPRIDRNGRALPPVPTTLKASLKGDALGLIRAILNTKRTGKPPEEKLAGEIQIQCAQGSIIAHIFASKPPQALIPMEPGGAPALALDAAVATSCLGALHSAGSSAPCNRQVISVNTTEKFLRALGSNRTILIEDGVRIDLSEADLPKTDHLRWGFEEPEAWRRLQYSAYPSRARGSLVIQGLHDLRILAAGTRARIESPVLLERVLELHNCQRIALQNLTLGHVVDVRRACVAGVLGLHSSRDVYLRKIDLFGCGTEGLIAWNTHEVTADALRIHDCAAAILAMQKCSGWTVRSGLFEDTPCYGPLGALWLGDCRSIHFANCTVRRLQAKRPIPVLQAQRSADIRFTGAIRDVSGFSKQTAGVIHTPLK